LSINPFCNCFVINLICDFSFVARKGTLAMGMTEARMKSQEPRLQGQHGTGGGRREDQGDDEGDDEEDEQIEEETDGGHFDVSWSAEAGVPEAATTTLFEKIGIHFAPVHQCLHVYTQMNLADEFQLLYREKRRGQLDRVAMAVRVLSSSSPSDENTPPVAADTPPAASLVQTLHDYLAELSAFFIVESSVARIGNGLTTSTELEALWDRALPKARITELFTFLYTLCANSSISSRSRASWGVWQNDATTQMSL
jgi:hypothetical protein